MTNHRLEPARLKPGILPADLPGPRPSDDPAEGGAPRVLRGRALIFWDPKTPGRKLDAIDTDQITPAADCVSESLETLDERWKAGSFRHLMPDFRQRVHRGETFLVAGERFAIGSSREMSPAGLKGVAEEEGHELVVVCGRNMGDIFRRNAFNLGLHVVQSQEAVEDAQDGDVFVFDPATRRLTNETRGKTYTPIPLSPKEEEIRSSGGIFAVGRREFRDSVRRTPEIRFPDPDLARRMTTTEQIVWAHRVDKDARVEPGATLRVYADLLPASDGTAPFAIHTFNQITGGRAIDPRQAAIANDHFVFTGREDDDRQTSIGREFARLHGLEKPYYANPGDGIFHFYFPEQGLVLPGQFIPGADSHSRAYGAYGAVGFGVGSTTLGFGWSTGYIYFTLARQRRVVLSGKLQPWVSGKDIVLELLRRWGAKQSQGMSVEFVDAERQLPIAFRNTIANMMAEAEALNGIFAEDDVTDALVPLQGARPASLSARRPGQRRRLRPRRDADALGDRADDRQAVRAGQRLSRRGSGARAPRLRPGDDRLVHQRRLRRPPLGRPRPPRRARARLPQGGAHVHDLSGIGRRRPADREAGPAPRRRVDRRGLPLGRRPDPAVVVRSVLRPGAGRPDARDSARSRPSTATGRTAWATAARASSPVPPSSRPPPSRATWPHPESWGCPGVPTASASEGRGAQPLQLARITSSVMSSSCPSPGGRAVHSFRASSTRSAKGSAGSSTDASSRAWSRSVPNSSPARLRASDTPSV